MEFDVLSIVQMIGGLALFIYGMTTMGKGLERAAGSKLEKTLEKMTGNVFTALIMGMVVTMVIQSSSATTVMVVGFVNAGIMTLKQSVGVILGANIGTTVTAQILRLSGGDGSGNLFMDLLKPKNLAYIIVLVGVIIMMLAKKRRTRDIADIFTGFGILFIMCLMSAMTFLGFGLPTQQLAYGIVIVFTMTLLGYIERKRFRVYARKKVIKKVKE